MTLVTPDIYGPSFIYLHVTFRKISVESTDPHKYSKIKAVSSLLPSLCKNWLSWLSHKYSRRLLSLSFLNLALLCSNDQWKLICDFDPRSKFSEERSGSAQLGLVSITVVPGNSSQSRELVLQTDSLGGH